MCVIRRALYSCPLDKKNQNYLYPLWLLRKCKKCKEFLKMEKVKIRTGDMCLVIRALYSSLLDKYSKFSYPPPRCWKTPQKAKKPTLRIRIPITWDPKTNDAAELTQPFQFSWKQPKNDTKGKTQLFPPVSRQTNRIFQLRERKNTCKKNKKNLCTFTSALFFDNSGSDIFEFDDCLSESTKLKRIEPFNFRFEKKKKTQKSKNKNKKQKKEEKKKGKLSAMNKSELWKKNANLDRFLNQIWCLWGLAPLSLPQNGRPSSLWRQRRARALPFCAPGVRRLMGGAPQNEGRKWRHIWRERQGEEDAVGESCVIFFPFSILDLVPNKKLIV